ncbi:MAG: FtsW/RodA/SpoVE family cell cycle protein [Bacteroidales bacterium]|nr:FtsW/RodA/SpoVE family cell cycle protein [Bacteroidales bacterium]
MEIQYYSATEKGSSHFVNEDSIIAPVEIGNDMLLFGVFDGISGNRDGEKASKLAAEVILSKIKDAIECSPCIKEAMIELTLQANQAIIALQKETGGKMGTTMTWCIIESKTKTLNVAHIGDSRLYKLEETGTITRLASADTDEEGRLTKWLGQPWPLDKTSIYFRTRFSEGDTIVAGSDGFVQTKEIEDYMPALSSGKTPADIVKTMLAQAKASSNDDISIIMLCSKGPVQTIDERKNNTINPDKKHTAMNSTATNKKMIKGFLFLAIVLAVISAAFLFQYKNLSAKFGNCENALLLNSDTPVTSLADRLNSSSRIEDRNEAVFIAKHIISSLKKDSNLPGIYVLSERDSDYGLSFSLDSAGRATIENWPYLGARLEAQDQRRGISDDMNDYVLPEQMKQEGSATYRSFTVNIREKGSFPLFKKRVKDSVILRITQHWAEGYEAKDSVYRYVLATKGKASISLPVKDSAGNALYYSVLPIQKGFSFGSEQRTYKNNFGRLNFTRSKAYLMPLDASIIKEIKKENGIIVRTPEQYRSIYLGSLFIILAAWLAVFFFTLKLDKKKGKTSNYSIIAAVAGITSLGILTQFSIPAHPLQDGLRAVEQLLKGLLPGIGLLMLASSIDWAEVFKRNKKVYIKAFGVDTAQGILFGAFTVITALLLLFIGSGPGGAKVNLWFFQGSPIIKYCLVGFLAIYLANRIDTIPAFASKNNNKYDRKHHLKLIVKLCALVCLLLVFQIVFLGDMGPGIVLALTAICLYSTCRKDTLPMIFGTLSFILMSVLWNYIIGNHWTLALPLIWGCGWIIYCRHFRGQIYESAIVVVIVISALIYGGQWLDSIGLHSMGERLSDRIEMWDTPFCNHTQSDQLALAIQECAEGGLTGSSTSTSYLVPASHTDLVWPTFVSHFGIIGGAALIFLFIVLFYSGLKIAVKCKTGFSFYLASGLISVIAVQCLLITGGTIGLWPLTGVNMFGLSSGSTDLVLSLGAVGVLISLSRENCPGYNWNGKKDAVESRLLLFMVSVLLLLTIITVSSVYSIFLRDTYLTKYTIVQKNSGEIAVEYAPAIGKFIKNNLTAGEIFDRDGNPLALNGPQGRIYPAGSTCFFWTGDINTQTLFSRTDRYTAGVLAEPRWLSFLRGYDNHPKRVIFVADKLKSPYFPDTDIYREDTVTVYDYKEVLPFYYSPEKTKAFNDSTAVASRSIHLTLDSKLQEAITLSAADFYANWTGRGITSRTRFSIVVIDAATGEVLASPCYPQADQNRLKAMAEAHINVYRDDSDIHFKAFPDMDLALCHPTNPGSIMKLFIAAAGFNKIGARMAEHKETVYDAEKIYAKEPTGTVSLLTALVKSSDIYFVKSLNDLDLFNEALRLYRACGVCFNGKQSYCLYSNVCTTNIDSLKADLARIRETGLRKYNNYCNSRKQRRLVDYEWTMAWGQGPVKASPIAVARLIGAIVNNGVLMKSKFNREEPDTVLDTLLTSHNAELLRKNMKPLRNAKIKICGKTGTSERYDRLSPKRKTNDAWYGAYIDGSLNPKTGHPLAVVVRFERVNAMSTLAVNYVDKYLLGVLQNLGYMSSL